MKEKYKKESVWMSYILRHGAIKEGVAIDKNGWVEINDLITNGIDAAGFPNMTKTVILEIVATDSKGRYALSPNQERIRANQGHSLDVDVQLKKAVPPVELYHGTSAKSLSLIGKQGLQKMSRTHVHLSSDVTTAANVGSRHGVPVVITIDSKTMFADGIEFFQSENGVWLVDQVDSKYFKFIDA
jgi:putative RNA 2'-phosphotransferase